MNLAGHITGIPFGAPDFFPSSYSLASHSTPTPNSWLANETRCYLFLLKYPREPIKLKHMACQSYCPLLTEPGMRPSPTPQQPWPPGQCPRRCAGISTPPKDALHWLTQTYFFLTRGTIKSENIDNIVLLKCSIIAIKPFIMSIHLYFQTLWWPDSLNMTYREKYLHTGCEKSRKTVLICSSYYKNHQKKLGRGWGLKNKHVFLTVL